MTLRWPSSGSSEKMWACPRRQEKSAWKKCRNGSYDIFAVALAFIEDGRHGLWCVVFFNHQPISLRTDGKPPLSWCSRKNIKKNKFSSNDIPTGRLVRSLGIDVDDAVPVLNRDLNSSTGVWKGRELEVLHFFRALFSRRLGHAHIFSLEPLDGQRSVITYIYTLRITYTYVMCLNVINVHNVIAR